MTSATIEAPATKPTTVYRLYDAGGELLYVDVASGQPEYRLLAHQDRPLVADGGRGADRAVSRPAAGLSARD